MHFQFSRLFNFCLIKPSVLTAPFFLTIIFAGLPVHGQAPETRSTVLVIGVPIERSLSGGQSESFRVDLSANQYARVTVEQKGIDVVVRLLDPDGKSAFDFDADPRTIGTEVVELVSRGGDSLVLNVLAKQRSAAAGKFEIRLTEVRPALEKDLALDDARRYLYTASELWRDGKYDEALPLAQKGCDIRENILGADSAEYSLALFTLANIYSDNGGIERAEELYQRAIAIREKAVGKDHISMTLLLNNYAVLLKDKGNYPKAEELFQRVLEIRRRELDPNHLLIASVLNNLAIIADRRGQTERALDLHQQTLKIRENALPPDHPDIATSLMNVAGMYSGLEQAEPLFKRALSIREKVYGPDSPLVGQVLYNFSRLYTLVGDYAKAEPMCLRALEIFEKTLGPDHPNTSYVFNLAGGIYAFTGRFNEAETAYRRAIEIKEKVFGSYHPELADAFTNLANLYAVKGESEKSLAAEARASEIYEFNTSLNLSIGSELQKLSYVGIFDEIQNQTLTLCTSDAAKNQQAVDLAATFVLRRKGRVLDAMSDSIETLRRRLTREDQSLIDKLNEINSKLSTLVINGPQNGNGDQYRKDVADLTSHRENIENQISRLSAGYYTTSKTATLSSVEKSIPEDAALIEFAKYSPVSLQKFGFSGRENHQAERYVAYVVRHSGEVKWADLGEASAIDAAVRNLRDALRDPKRSDFRPISRVADRLLMQPLRSMIGDTTHLLVSSDAELNLLPFEALIDEKDRYLVEDHQITYLTSGRDLLQMGSDGRKLSAPLIIANPSFGTLATLEATRIDAETKPAATRRAKQSVTATRSIADTYFAPLSGTSQEAQAIKKLFPEFVIHEGSDATKSSLKKAAAPRILHIATHGFFLTDENLTFSRERGGNTPIKNSALIENPLIRSGLAFAGANRHGTAENDGIMTALEASGLDLWGTRLVVLSACDTGVGEIRTGEGVYGLRRAFVEAGAESLVMSLWPVSDIFTKDLMVNYYKNLKQGMGRGEALRQVQLGMLKRPDRRHPFYWASFIQAGEWANLEGKR